MSISMFIIIGVLGSLLIIYGGWLFIYLRYGDKKLLRTVMMIGDCVVLSGVIALGVNFTVIKLFIDKQPKVAYIHDITEQVKAQKPGEMVTYISLDEYHDLYGKYHKNDPRIIRYGFDHPDMTGKYPEM